MEGVKRALAASIVSRGWAALLGLLAVPLYLQFLGIESYGLVGFFASFQALVSFLDLGLGATLTRELAQLTGDFRGLAYGRDVTRTFEVAYVAVAILIGALLVLGAPLIAHYWIKAEALNRLDATQALILAGVSLAC